MHPIFGLIVATRIVERIKRAFSIMIIAAVLEGTRCQPLWYGSILVTNTFLWESARINKLTSGHTASLNTLII